MRRALTGKASQAMTTSIGRVFLSVNKSKETKSWSQTYIVIVSGGASQNTGLRANKYATLR